MIEERKRYIKENGYLQGRDGVWMYAELIYDTELDLYVNPDGSPCHNARVSIPYGEISFHAHDISSQDGKRASNEEPIKLKDHVVKNINAEYESYEDELKEYLDE